MTELIAQDRAAGVAASELVGHSQIFQPIAQIGFHIHQTGYISLVAKGLGRAEIDLRQTDIRPVAGPWIVAALEPNHRIGQFVGP
jgi:hypothetical protein